MLNTSTAQNHGAIVHLRRGSPSIPWLDLGKSMVENNVFFETMLLHVITVISIDFVQIYGVKRVTGFDSV